jgi:hypothetical protein
VREEIKKLDDQAVGYLDSLLQKKEIQPDRYMWQRDAILASVPPTDPEALKVSRVLCEPVRAHADRDAKSQKEIEALREQHKASEDNKRKYDVLQVHTPRDPPSSTISRNGGQAEYDELKKKMGDLDKLTPQSVADKMLGSKEPPKLVSDKQGAVLAADGSTVMVDAVEAAGEDEERLGVWGTRRAWKSFVDDSWTRAKQPGINPFSAAYAELDTTTSKKGEFGLGFAFNYKNEKNMF